MLELPIPHCLNFYKIKKRITNDSMIIAHIKIVEKIDEK